jgi:ribonuclease HI
MAKDKVVIYTDGACDPNPGPGGWAAILRSGPHEKVIRGSDPNTTNNRMELRAALAALKTLKRGCRVALHTDSEYLRQGITSWLPSWKSRGWRTTDRRPVQNQDLWQALASEVERHQVEWHWVRGHAGDPLNERVDRLARAAIPQSATYGVGGQADEVNCTVHMFTRASCLGSPGPGGWAVVKRRGDALTSRSGSAAQATANEMELLAAIHGFKTLSEPCHVCVHTVSKYLHQGVTRWVAAWKARGWQTKEGQPVRHKATWLTLLDALDGHKVEWVFVPSGSRPPESEQAATLAAQAARTERERASHDHENTITDSLPGIPS